MRILQVSAFVSALGGNGVARAEPDAPVLPTSEASREDRAQLESNEKRAQDAHAQVVHDRREVDRQTASVAFSREQWGAEQDSRAHSRSHGYIVLGVGAVAAAGAGVFAYLGKSQNDAILNGGFRRASDIADTASLGTTYNDFGWGCAAAAAIAVVIAIPVIALNLGQGEVVVSPSVGKANAGLSLGGHF